MAFVADYDDSYFADDDCWDFGDPTPNDICEPTVSMLTSKDTSQQAVNVPWHSAPGDPVVSPFASKPKGIHAGRGRGILRACNTDGFSLPNTLCRGHRENPDIPSGDCSRNSEASMTVNVVVRQTSPAVSGVLSNTGHGSNNLSGRTNVHNSLGMCGIGRGMQFEMTHRKPTPSRTKAKDGSVIRGSRQENKQADIDGNAPSSWKNDPLGGQLQNCQQSNISATVNDNQRSGTVSSNVPKGPEEVDEQWLKCLENKWSSMEHPKSVAISGMLRKCLSEVVNPYLTALYIIEHSRDFHHGKTTTFAFAVTKELDAWAAEDEECHLVCIDREVRIAAFHIGCKGNMIYLNMLIRAFRMKHPGNDYFIQLIQPYIEKKKYKEAAHCVTNLELQDHFTIEDICLPLIIQDKINLVESYVCKKQKHQVALLKLLDHLVDNNTDLHAVICDSGVPRVNWEKMTRKILSKLATRLLKLYQVSQDLCPNIANESLLKGLRYLVYKRYMEHGLGTAQWLELVQSTADGNELAQLELVEQLLSYCDTEEAARWAKHYALPLDKLPHQVLPLLATAKSIEVASDELNDMGISDMSASHHTLKLEEESIHWIDTKKDFYKCLDHVSKPGVVGIDAEWRPSIGQMVPCRMSVLQLATHSDVHLLDMLRLEDVLEDEDWQQWVDKFFSNEQVLKVGYGLEGDLQMIAKTLPSIREALNDMKSVLDLQTIYNNICKACPTAFDVTTPADQSRPINDFTSNTLVIKSEEHGLSDLVRLCLGKPLNKGQQMSDWQKRPLRRQQILYAALDAYCLLEVYDVLTTKIKELAINIDIQSTIRSKTKPRRTRNERKQQRVAEKPERNSGRTQVPPNPPPRSGMPISPSQLKVVCDNMLQGLGRYLRCCGVNVCILDNADSHDVCATISRKEGRIILTSGSPFKTLRNQVPLGHCYNVGPGKAKDQVKEVLTHFNVEVSSGDIFTRCQVCNGDHYLLVDPAEMRQAWLIKMYGHEQKDTRQQTEEANQVAASEKKPNTNNLTSPKKKSKKCDSASDGDVEGWKYDHVDLDTLKVGPNHVPLLVDALPEAMLNKVDVFYVCSTCGKIFWEGGHFRRVLKHFSHIIKSNTSGSYLENVLHGKNQPK